MTYYLLKPCRTSAGYTSTLKKRTKLDLKDAKLKLEAAGFKVTDVEVMLILEGPGGMTVYESGKILLKTDDRAEAQQLVDSVYGILGLSEPKIETPAQHLSTSSPNQPP
jgi:hypothetical protein